ncbi:alpha-tocopherol transfer protein-like [Rhipicephalus sanguineus]|uniref:alpha-tocopherol transfer protein-like n=1 Tax=Rhipicephalus sanguineus TaxID=34632 RepID=UPI0020C55B92|nr:alpha-tocopherol transfer protein-like [Rhipicephalus sanguineus]
MPLPLLTYRRTLGRDKLQVQSSLLPPREGRGRPPPRLRSLLRIASVGVAAAGRCHSPATSLPTSFGPSGKLKRASGSKHFEPSPDAPPSSSTKEASLHVPSDEKFLLMFLRAKKYNVEEAFRVFQNYIRARRDVPEFFRDVTPASVRLREICHENHLVMTSMEADALGRSIALMRLGAWDPTMCSFIDFIRGTMALTSSNFYEDAAQIRGVAAIVDLEGLGFHHFRQLTPALLIKIAHITQDCSPMRVKAVYVINYPSAFKALFEVVKPFLKHKLLTRIHFVGEDASELWKICPRGLVPAEFGGTRNEFDFDRQEESVLRKTRLFEELCVYDRPPP